MLELAYQGVGAFASIVRILGFGIVIVMVARSGLITNIYVQIKIMFIMLIFIKDSLYRLKIADELVTIILISILKINIDFQFSPDLIFFLYLYGMRSEVSNETFNGGMKSNC